MTRVEPRPDGTFRPSEDGQWALTLGVDDREGRLVDFVAYFLNNPGRWWLRFRDETPFLGARDLAFAADCGKSIRLFSTPDTWLRAQLRHGDHEAVCVLNWGVDLCPLFDGIEAVVCNTPGLARRLREKLREWEPEVRHAA
ncbi:MAG: hypothetical protein V3U93_01260 [Alphaproteobacteria bacterium]